MAAQSAMASEFSWSELFVPIIVMNQSTSGSTAFMVFGVQDSFGTALSLSFSMSNCPLPALSTSFLLSTLPISVSSLQKRDCRNAKGVCCLSAKWADQTSFTSQRRLLDVGRGATAAADVMEDHQGMAHGGSSWSWDWDLDMTNSGG